MQQAGTLAIWCPVFSTFSKELADRPTTDLYNPPSTRLAQFSQSNSSISTLIFGPCPCQRVQDKLAKKSQHLSLGTVSVGVGNCQWPIKLGKMPVLHLQGEGERKDNAHLVQMFSHHYLPVFRRSLEEESQPSSHMCKENLCPVLSPVCGKCHGPVWEEKSHKPIQDSYGPCQHEDLILAVIFVLWAEMTIQKEFLDYFKNH